jgi:hypothetical protein
VDTRNWLAVRKAPISAGSMERVSQEEQGLSGFRRP